jgi:lipoate-protein ligase B
MSQDSKVTREEAEDIAMKVLHESVEIDILDADEVHHHVYTTTPITESWIAIVKRRFGQASVIESSEIVIISKREGTVTYHGPAQDEG